MMFQEFPEDNLNDNFLSDRRQKIADENISDFNEQKMEMNRSKSVFLGAVSGLALAGIVGWFALSPRYLADNEVEIPVIRRPQTAVKVQPQDPGGMEILNQDKSVYDIIDRTGAEAPQVESILPATEKPILPEVKAETPAPQTDGEQPAPATATENNSPAPAPETVAAEPPVKEPARPAKPQTAPQAVEKLPAPATMDEIKQLKAAPQPAAQKPVAAVSKSTADILSNIAANTEKAPAPKPAAASSGDWQVQLMSSQNQKAVASAWSGLVKKHKALSGQPHEIETADLGAKGTFFRLKAGAFATRAEADKLCNTIKKQGGSCIVKKK